tara:strand:+ start:254 stop:688 length:435 start_codon:yes stop_codon:yes gene_type:complete
MTDSPNSHTSPSIAGIRIVATYKHEQKTHNDGYCSDPGEYTEEEEMKVIDFLVPPPCHEFLDQYMDGNKFVGTLKDLKGVAQYVYNFCSQFTRRQFRDLGFDRNYRYFCKTIMELNQTHAPSGCNGYCAGYSFKRLISVEIVKE